MDGGTSFVMKLKQFYGPFGKIVFFSKKGKMSNINFIIFFLSFIFFSIYLRSVSMEV